MKFLDKVKNMFTEVVEEEEDKVKVEQVDTKVKKDNIPKVVDSFEEVKVQKEEVKKPVFFTDHDFEDMEKKQNNFSSKPDNESYSRVDYSTTRSSYHNTYREEKKETYSKPEAYRGNQTNIYNDPYKEKKEERVFKPTPIISPVYGILDKNYHKEDIVSKKDVNYTVPSEISSIDAVRKKAYGTLEDELENTLFGSNSILFNNKDQENKNDNFFDELENEARPDLLDNLDVKNDDDESGKKIRDLEEITMDIGKELNSLLNKKENLKREEKKETVEDDDDDLFNLIDTMYEGDE